MVTLGMLLGPFAEKVVAWRDSNRDRDHHADGVDLSDVSYSLMV